jgi:uncharacterized protein
VTRLARQPGQKDARFAHLLSGLPNLEMAVEASATAKPGHRASDSERIAKLEEQISTLTEKIDSLSDQFEKFKQQFE